MESKPFTLQQASAIVKDFSYLVGKPFGESDEVTIQNILVAPFDAENKDVFVKNYKKFGSRPDELDGYVGHFYDVLVVARGDAAENKIEYDHIRSYARGHNYPYVFPEYPFN
jgi:hypothetical protein